MELREQVDTCRSAPPGDWITVPLRQVAARAQHAGARSAPFKWGAVREVRRTPHRMHAVTTARAQTK